MVQISKSQIIFTLSNSEICGMGGRSDSAVVRARYSSDVDGINRFKHFHTPINSTDKQPLKKVSSFKHLPNVDEKVQATKRIVMEISKKNFDPSPPYRQQSTIHLPMLVLNNDEKKKVPNDIIIYGNDSFNQEKLFTKQFRTKSFSKRDIILTKVSNSILRQASDYESGISKSSSFSNNSSIISNHTNDSPLENKKKPAVLVDLRSAVPQSLYKNKNKVSNITATTQLRMSERILKKVNDGLSDKLSIVGNKMQFHSSAESISIDKAGKGKPLISKLGKKRLKGLQYGMKSFSSDNINDGVLKGDNEVNFEKGYNGHLSLKIVNNVSISTQTEIIKNKRVKKEPRIMVDNSEINVRSKDQPRIEIESVIIADEITTFSSSRIDNKLSKASQTINHRLMSVDKKSLTDMNEDYQRIELYNEYTKALNETIDKESREYLHSLILSTIKQQGEAWKDAKKFVSSVLLPQSVNLANRTHSKHL